MSSSSRVTKTMAPIGAGMRPRAYVNISYDHGSPGLDLGERVDGGGKWKDVIFTPQVVNLTWPMAKV